MGPLRQHLLLLLSNRAHLVIFENCAHGPRATRKGDEWLRYMDKNLTRSVSKSKDGREGEKMALSLTAALCPAVLPSPTIHCSHEEKSSSSVGTMRATESCASRLFLLPIRVRVSKRRDAEERGEDEPVVLPQAWTPCPGLVAARLTGTLWQQQQPGCSFSSLSSRALRAREVDLAHISQLCN